MSNQVAVEVTTNITQTLGHLAELREELPADSPAQKEVKELEKSLEKIEKETDPEKVKKSPALSKFRRMVEKIGKGNSEVEKVLKTAGKSVDILRDVAGKYNKIAEWCGLPVVPSIFTK